MGEILISNLTVLIALGGLIVILTLIQLFLAVNQDKRETNAGPIKELEELKVEIERKEAQKLEMEGQLEKFRRTLAEQAELMAQVDYLLKRKEELQTEWNSLADKRTELKEFLSESEKIQFERAEIETALKAAQTELDEIKERLIQKDELDRLIEQLQTSKQEYEIELKKLRDEASDIKQLKADEEHLKGEISNLESKISEFTGLKQAKETELSQINIQLEKVKAQSDEIAKRHAEMQEQRSEFLAEYNAEIAACNSIRKEKDHLSAEIEVLTVLAEQKRAELSGQKSGDSDRDQLEELKAKPPVIRELLRLEPTDIASEQEALNNVKARFDALNLKYHDRVLNAFHTTMKTNETTQMAVLAGISGTGKSQLPRQYALGMGIGFLQIPVQPRWDSPQDLMGFYNYIEGKFKPTDMAKALWAMDEQNNPDAIDDRMLMIMLDEMNLARVEYYFSDFLSRLESRPNRNLVKSSNERKDAEIELEIPGQDNQTIRLFPGYNLLFAGTMNEDETTQSLSDKVIDRANVLRFGAPEELVNSTQNVAPSPAKALSRSRWQEWVRNPSILQADARYVDNSISKFSELMKEFGRPFGHRLAAAMRTYVANYPQTEGMDRIKVALADQIEMRLLPKLRGVDVGDYGTQFAELQTYVQNELNDSALNSAIQTSVELAQNTSQFTWVGVTRR